MTDRQARLRQVVRRVEPCRYGMARGVPLIECDDCCDRIVSAIEAERDRLWCKALIDEDSAVIERITKRFNELRGTTGGDRPVSLDNVIDALGKAIRVRGGDER